MARQKQRLSLTRHQELGTELAHLAVQLLDLTVELRYAFGKTSKVKRAVERTSYALDELRSQLDDIVSEDFNQVLDYSYIYYGVPENGRGYLNRPEID